MISKDKLRKTDREVHLAILKERRRQRTYIELIASENFVSHACMEAVGSCLTNKYAEGYPGRRYYNGCENVDKIEQLAIDRVKQLFGAEHANVQPHSGSGANLAVYLSVLTPGDTIMGMDLASGGHLTHGAKVSISGKYYNVVSYGLDPETELLDYKKIENLAIYHKPKLIIAGASAYPRVIDFEKFREIADKVGAYLMVDMAHIAGLVAAGQHPSPVPYADFVTTTTHKTLRGPRGAVILCKEKYAKIIDSAVFPGTQGGPLEHVIAGKAVCFKEALEPEFKSYAEQVVINAKTLADELTSLGFRLVTGGTDTHLMLVDLTNFNITGKKMADLLHSAHITCNKNSIPNEKLSPSVTSGIRIGTAAVTTLGMNKNSMRVLASLIHRIAINGADAVKAVRSEVKKLMEPYI